MVYDQIRREIDRQRALFQPYDLEVQRAIRRAAEVGQEVRREMERSIEAMRPQASVIRETVEQLAEGPGAQAMRDLERLRSPFKG